MERRESGGEVGGQFAPERHSLPRTRMVEGQLVGVEERSVDLERRTS
ncbi:MAG: hypothetical protein RLZZ01_2042, partial [Actinomycetota bacterium]